MKYVIREGKKPGRGTYLREVPLFDGVVMYCGTKKQRKATRFDTLEEARRIAQLIEVERGQYQLTVAKQRVVRLKERT